MNFILQCILEGLKAVILSVLVLSMLAIPVYLFLDVSPWFIILIAIEICFIVGFLLKATK